MSITILIAIFVIIAIAFLADLYFALRFYNTYQINGFRAAKKWYKRRLGHLSISFGLIIILFIISHVSQH
jgi:hypothetical protein